VFQFVLEDVHGTIIESSGQAEAAKARKSGWLLHVLKNLNRGMVVVGRVFNTGLKGR